MPVPGRAVVQINSSRSNPATRRSEPPGATVLVNGEKVGTTPCTVTLPRVERPLFTLQLEGYHDQPIDPGRGELNVPLIMVDLLLFPFFLVDVATSALFTVNANPIHVFLTRKDGPPPRIWKRKDFDVRAHH